MKAPILLNHNPYAQIGKVNDDGTVELEDGHEMTEAQLFDTFGNIGVKVIKFVVRGPIDTPENKAKNLRVKSFQIMEWSLSPEPAKRSDT